MRQIIEIKLSVDLDEAEIEAISEMSEKEIQERCTEMEEGAKRMFVEEIRGKPTFEKLSIRVEKEAE